MELRRRSDLVQVGVRAGVTDMFGGTNVHRPKLLRKRTFLMPIELNDDLEFDAAHRGVSVNEVFLSAMENEFARRSMVGLPFGLDYYDHIRPMRAQMKAQGYRRIAEFIGQLLSSIGCGESPQKTERT
ncbi:MAG: hypothetical protein Q7U76_12540 [Nitrospirota bacterium]|nr:hypothetical protein [Nitrospirota bacterium]